MATVTQWPIAVLVPSFGVRATLEGSNVRVALGDDGGKGNPWKAVFIPVVQVGERLQLAAADGKGIPDPRLEQFDALKHGERIEDGRAVWFDFDIPCAQWPQGPDGVLAVLYYFKVKGIGGGNWILHPTEAEYANHWQHAFERLVARLKNDSADTLSAGVIQLERPAQNRDMGPQRPVSHSVVSFAVASCAYPGDLLDRSPINGQISSLGPADASLSRLARRVGGPAISRSSEAVPRPRFLLLAGDQIYADATAGLFDPTVRDDIYRNSYQGFFGSQGARSVFNKLPVYMMLDDHEIYDNWQPEGEPNSGADKRNKARMEEGRKQYWDFQRNAGPARTYANDDTFLWAAIAPHGVPVFMADTRTERVRRTAKTFQSASIMGPLQFGELEAWLKARKDDPCPSFVLSASMLLPRPLGLKEDPASALRCDSWAGYPKSLHRLLAFLCENEIHNAVFLSGDEHLSSFTQVSITCEATDRSVCLRSIHSSALYAPYPFANAVEEDFACAEAFGFTDPDQRSNSYRCEVRTQFPTLGDGFAVVTVQTKENAAWEVKVCFDKVDDEEKNPCFTFASTSACLSR